MKLSTVDLLTPVLVDKNLDVLAGFKEWVFRLGMNFGDNWCWWKSGKKRRTVHEGIDFYQYLTRTGEVCSLPSGLIIPVFIPGRVVRIFPDFSGFSVVMAHEQQKDGAVLHTIFAHIQPCESLQPGRDYRQGYPLGILTSGNGENRAVPLHFHLSVAWVKDDLNPDDFNWQLFNDSASVTLIDPQICLF